MKTQTRLAWMGAAAALMLATDAAPAQTPAKDDPKVAPVLTPMPTTQPKRVRAVRKPVVDLDSMAKDRRPGQVMPGDPAPMGAAPTKMMDSSVPADASSNAPESKPITAASLEANAAKPTIKLPDTAPYNKPVLKPVGDTSARPEVLNGSLPAPMPEAPVAQNVPEATTAEVATPVVAAPVATATIVAPVEALPTPVPAAPVVERIEPEPIAPPPVEKIIDRPQIAPAGTVPLVDGVVMTQLPSPLSTGGASVRVESMTGDGTGVQWRTGNGPWSTPSVGQTAEGKIEIRAGLDSQVVLVVDGLAEVRVTRLGRAAIERCTEQRGATSVGVAVMRGAVELRPVGAAVQESAKGQLFARVRTPDQNFGLSGPLRVEFDAFSGTRRRVVNP